MQTTMITTMLLAMVRMRTMMRRIVALAKMLTAQEAMLLRRPRLVSVFLVPQSSAYIHVHEPDHSSALQVPKEQITAIDCTRQNPLMNDGDESEPYRWTAIKAHAAFISIMPWLA